MLADLTDENCTWKINMQIEVAEKLFIFPYHPWPSTIEEKEGGSSRTQDGIDELGIYEQGSLH